MLSASHNFTLQNVNVLEVIEEILIVHAAKVNSINLLMKREFYYSLQLDTPRPPEVSVGCRSNSDCPDYTACENRKCINPCAVKDPCARNAFCKVVNHRPVCTCPDGYIGDPQTSCELRKYKVIGKTFKISSHICTQNSKIETIWYLFT